MRAALSAPAQAPSRGPSSEAPRLLPPVSRHGASSPSRRLRFRGRRLGRRLAPLDRRSGARSRARRPAAGLAGAVALPRLSGSALWCLGLATALVVWLGVSIAWSVEPDRSWTYFDRGVVYLALLGVGILAGGLVRRAPTVAAAELALVVGLVLAVGLAVKVFPSLYPDTERIARLRAPVGYWNALALLFAFGLPLALWLAGLAGRRTGLRALAVVFVYLLGVGLALTFSRGGILAALAAVVVALALGRDRVQRLVDLAVAGTGAALVSAWALGQPGLAADRIPLSARAADGHQLALALVLGALAVAGLTVALSRLRLADRLPRFSRRWAIGAALLAAVLLAVAVAASDPGARIDEFRNPPAVDVSQEGGRLTSLSSNHRWTWWGEAWEIFMDHPFLGVGAGSFGVAHRQVRVSDLDAVEPHNLPLQFLAETGLVGALLAGGAALAAAIAALGALRRAEGPRARRHGGPRLRARGLRRPGPLRLRLGLPGRDRPGDARDGRPAHRGRAIDSAATAPSLGVCPAPRRRRPPLLPGRAVAGGEEGGECIRRRCERGTRRLRSRRRRAPAG